MNYLPNDSLKLVSHIVKDPAHGYLIAGGKSSNIDYFIECLTKAIIGFRKQKDSVERILELKPDKDNKISKKQVQELLLTLINKQSTSRRVVVINNAEKLSISSHNSLLKTLEEPGINTTLIMTCENISKLPKTVISRLQIIKLPALSVQEILDNIESLDSNKASKLAVATANDIEQLEKLAESTDLKDRYLADIELIKQILSAKPYERIILCKDYWKDRSRLAEIIDILINLCRAAMYAAKQSNLKAKQWSKRLKVLENAKNRNINSVSTRLIICELMVQL